MKKLKKALVVCSILAGVGFSSTFNASRAEAAGKWVYQYTVEPYSFYKNSATGKVKMVQTTSTWNHTINNIIGGWVTKSNTNYPYKKPTPIYTGPKNPEYNPYRY